MTWTSEARLLRKGWAPSANLVQLIEQREALRAALGQLSLLQRDQSAVAQAIREGDALAISDALKRHAVGIYLDQQLQHMEGEVMDWWTQLRNALSKAIAANPQAVIGSLDGIPGAETDGAELLKEARSYLDESSRQVGLDRKPWPARPWERRWELIPRQLRPLPERSE